MLPTFTRAVERTKPPEAPAGLSVLELFEGMLYYWVFTLMECFWTVTNACAEKEVIVSLLSTGIMCC